MRLTSDANNSKMRSHLIPGACVPQYCQKLQHSFAMFLMSFRCSSFVFSFFSLRATLSRDGLLIMDLEVLGTSCFLLTFLIGSYIDIYIYIYIYIYKYK
jgi:hypothetical protein